MSDIEFSPMDLARVVAGHLEADTSPAEPAEEVAAADTEESQAIVDARGNLHDPEDGKFIPKAEEEAEETEEENELEAFEEDVDIEDEEEEEALALDVDDPEILAYLAKYNNDPVAALKAATNLQSVLGRQGSENGELKAQIQELRALVEQRMTAPPLQTVNFAALLDPDSEQFNPEQAASIALQQGDANALQAAMQTWTTVGPYGEEPTAAEAFKAATFWNGVQQRFMLETLAQELGKSAPAAQPDQELDREVAGVMTRHPDLETYLPQIGALANERPLMRQALESGTPAERAQALEDLYLLARGRDSDTLTGQAKSQATAETKKAAKKARSEAAVVSATRGTAAAASEPLTGVDRFRSAFASRLGLPEDYDK